MAALSIAETTEILKNCPAELRAKLVQTWLAYSATNIVFTYDGHLVLGDLVERNPDDKAIPETGDTSLIGGFNNSVVAGPCSLKELADAHLLGMLGVNIDECHYTEKFGFTEYPKEAMAEMLKTPFGDFSIKRVSFQRIVILTKEQSENLKPGGKIKDVFLLDHEAFQQNYYTQVSESKCRFRYQLVDVAWAFIRRNHYYSS